MMILRFFAIVTKHNFDTETYDCFVGFSKCLAKSDKQKGIFLFEKYLKAVAFFEKFRNEIRLVFSIRYFVTPKIFMLIKDLVHLQFC